MKGRSRLTRCALILLLCGIPVCAQSIEELRAQLRSVQDKETELQTRIQQLDEALKPENIERSLLLNGSTHPEDLREQRRRQLEAEKANVQSQLDQLAVSRTRLESAIATAEAAPSMSTGGTETANTQQTQAVAKKQRANSASKQRRRARRRRPKRKG